MLNIGTIIDNIQLRVFFIRTVVVEQFNTISCCCSNFNLLRTKALTKKKNERQKIKIVEPHTEIERRYKKD